MVIDFIADMGRRTISLVQTLGAMTLFFAQGFLQIFSMPFQFFSIIQQVYYVGARSIPIIALTGAFSGMVLSLQAYYALAESGSEGLLGSTVGLSLIRELGPVLTALMITAGAGSAIAAEIGVMRISEQIDALTTMDISPVRFLISPKIAAGLISFPLLTAFFDVVGIYGGYFTGSRLLGVSSGLYFSAMDARIDMYDIAGGFIKSEVFAVLVITVCCFQGYYTHMRAEGYGAKGVGLATTSAVVLSSILVLATDYVLTSFLI